MGATSSELLKLIKNYPEGAESLIIHIIHILTEQRRMINYRCSSFFYISLYLLVPPPDELVKNIKDLYYKRISDIRFLIPILPYLEKVCFTGIINNSFIFEYFLL
jgi:symplekin